MEKTTRPLPLDGVRIVENDSFVAGPTAGLTLAQLGAEVIKIDPLGGGPDFRRWPLDATGDSLFWSSLNRGKKSVALDLRSAEGRELAVALITAPDSSPDRQAGVFVDNNVGRKFLDPELLRSKRSDLIHVRIQGKSDGSAGVDYTVNAETGIPAISGPSGWGDPVNSVVPTWDLMCAMASTTAVTSGLYRRSMDGSGGYYEIALEDIALSSIANMGWLTDAIRGGTREKIGNHIYGTFGTDFTTADGQRVMVAALTPRQWKVLMAATETGESFAAIERSMGTDFFSESARFTHRNLIKELLRPWLGVRDFAEVERVFNKHGVLWSRYKTLDDVVDTIRENAGTGLFAGAEMAGSEPSLAPSSPIRLDGGYGPTGEEARIGQHTEVVLADVLGLSTRELGALAQAKVIDI